jgi:drug/metabolite transporter (DMT)-like permease
MTEGKPMKSGSARIMGIVLVNVATLTWATNIVLGRLLRDQIGPLTLAASRFLVASSMLLILLQRRPAQERRMGRDRWLLLGMAVTGVVLFSPLLYFGLNYTTAVSATLINALGPLITGLLAGLIIHEPMSRSQGVGALLGIIGVSVLISGGSVEFWQHIGRNPGDLIILGAVTLWALYSVLGRRVTAHRSAISATALSTFLGVPLLLVVAFWELRTTSVENWLRLVPVVLYIGIVPTVVGHVSWNESVRRLGASGAMVFYNTLPLYGVLLAYLLLGETLSPAHLLGGGLIIAGGLWAARAQRSGSSVQGAQGG